MPGSEEVETSIISVAGNFAIVNDYTTDSYGKAFGIYHRNGGTEEWTRVRAYNTNIGHNMVTIESGAVIAVGVSPGSHLGNALIGDTYGGNRGDSGSDFIDVPEYGTLIHKIDSIGVVSNPTLITLGGFCWGC
jgi:hypothetical protein